MKKIFTLFAVALVGICANAAVSEYGPCPSELSLALQDGSNPSNVRVELKLKNASQRLNGWNVQFSKASGSESLAWKNFSATNYASVILQNWVGTTEIENEDGDLETVEITDAVRKSQLNNKCDIKSNIKNDGADYMIIYILSTTDPRFFPVLEEATAVGRIGIDMSACADGDYTIIAPDVPTSYSFSYTKAADEEVCPEPLTAWTGDAPIELTLNKTGNDITEVIDAISTIAVDQPVDNRIFDLQGRELQSVPEHGIYIQNGKKYVK